MADRVVFMDGGVVVEAGSPAEVIGNPQHERTRNFLRRMLSEQHETADGAAPGASEPEDAASGA